MNYGRIIPFDIGNGPDVRVSLFVSGCTNGCKGCFNKAAQNFSFGQKFTQETWDEVIDYLDRGVVAGLSLLGGDPLCQSEEDIHLLATLCHEAHRLSKNVWVWTGLTWEQVLDKCEVSPATRELLADTDILVDGPFMEDLKNFGLYWRGSSNQRVIHVPKSLREGHVVEI